VETARGRSIADALRSEPLCPVRMNTVTEGAQKEVTRIQLTLARDEPQSASESGANDFVLINSGTGTEGCKSEGDSGVRPSVGREPDAVPIIGLCGCLSRSLPENGIVTYTDSRD
jgi:hypothetical protein